MNGYKAFSILKTPSKVKEKDLHIEGRLLLQEVRAVRTELVYKELVSRETAAQLLETNSIAYFPQDRGKMIYTKSEETPINAKRLPGFIWLPVKDGISLGFVRNRLTIAYKRKLNEYKRRKREIKPISARRRG